MAKPKKRDSAYWLRRLRSEHPRIHERLAVGKLPSVRAACIEAGLMRQPTRLKALKREWKRASASERREFVDWVKGGGTAGVPLGMLTDKSGFLTASAIKQVEEVMKARRMRSGDVMEEFGYKRLDPTLGMVLAGRWKPSENLLRRLKGFLP